MSEPTLTPERCPDCMRFIEPGGNCLCEPWYQCIGCDNYLPLNQECPCWLKKEKGQSDTTNPKDLVGAKKPQLHLVPPALTIHVSKAMENGAAKFGAYNWREKKVRNTVYLAAAMRHLLAYLDGEDCATDSGVHHLAHAAACCGIVLDAEATKSLIDDRPHKGAAAKLIEEFTTK